MTQTTHAAPDATGDLGIAGNPDRRLRTVSSMMAWRVHEYGPPNVMKFERIPRPDPGPGEVLVKVEAAGVGPWDGWIRAGKGAQPEPLPLTLGSDLAGEVVAVGQGVSRPRVGEQIYGVTNSRFVGAYAEYALASAAMVSSKPALLSYIEAAGVPVVAVTARQALFDQASQTVKPRPSRWLSVGNGRFLLVSNLANGNKAAFSGRCGAGNGMPAVPPPALQRPPTQPSSTWTVPIQRQGKAIILNGTLNDTMPVRWMLDTGASLSTIPQEMADRLRARVVDTRTFQLADGRIITANVVVIAKLSVGGVVSASNVHAAVSGYGTDPLLGKNFLDYFGSFEINNRSAQLLLRR